MTNQTQKPNQKFNRTIELRDAQFTENEEKQKILEGYAVVFDKPTVLFEEYGI